MASVVRDKSFIFAVHVVRCCQVLHARREYVMSRQLLRSGTAIGALVREADQAESRADFIHKMAVALKEAHEATYWLELLHETKYLVGTEFEPMHRGGTELFKLLSSIVKSTKEKPSIKSSRHQSFKS